MVEPWPRWSRPKPRRASSCAPSTPPVVEAMWDTGLMTRFNPVEAGGAEPTFAEMIQTWIDMARLDGSFGWIGIANLPSAAAIAAYLPDAGFAEVFSANDNRVTLGGQFFPNGTGDAVDGGYRVTGAWNFGSGTGHSEYVAAGFMPIGRRRAGVGRGRHPRAPGRDRPRDDVRVHRRLARPGPEGHRLVRLRARRRLRPRAPDLRPVHPASRSGARRRRSRMGFMPIVAAGHAGWALGVARSMLDDVAELAVTKIAHGRPATLANKASFQVGLAHHESHVAGRAAAGGPAFGDVEAAVGAGEELTPTDARRPARGGGLRHRLLPRDRASGRTSPPAPRRSARAAARAGLPRHLHRHPARVHRREGGDRRGPGLARPRSTTRIGL